MARLSGPAPWPRGTVLQPRRCTIPVIAKSIEGKCRVLLTIDIGNTQTTMGLFQGEDMVARWAVTTQKQDTVDEAHAMLASQVLLGGRSLDCIEDVAMASVVPSLTNVWAGVAQRITGKEPVVVGPGVKTQLPMRYGNPAEVGADRVADAVAALELYGAPAVVVDLGTATNIEVLGKDGSFLGGIIAPGLMTGADALFSHAARLSQVDLAVPDHVIGTSTADALRSGLILGEVERIDGLVRRIFDELGCTAPVIATGGLASAIAGASSTIKACEPNLTLLGLRMIYEKNRG